jgi:hypothetical protein
MGHISFPADQSQRKSFQELNFAVFPTVIKHICKALLPLCQYTWTYMKAYFVNHSSTIWIQRYKALPHARVVISQLQVKQ